MCSILLYQIQKRLSSELFHCALHFVACQGRKALWSTLLPTLIHECRCLIVHVGHLQCYLKVRYIHGALRSGYAAMRNAQFRRQPFLN